MSKNNPVIIKRDTRENWRKSNYIPKENVIVIMDNPDRSISLLIGDGETNVNQLPDVLEGFSRGATVNSQDVLIL